MRLLALVESLDGASARLRIERWQPWLAGRGVSVELQAIERSGPRRWRQLAAAARYDGVWLQRRLLQPWESALLRVRARRLVVDLDDAVWRRDRPPFRSLGRTWRARALCSRADVVVAGAASLANELAELSVRAAVLPTPLADLANPAAAAASSHVVARAAAPTVAWIGQPSTWRYVAPFAAAWPTIRAQLPEARFVVVGAPQGAAQGDGIEQREWSPASEVALLEEAWLGLAPLPDDPWTRGKCGARLLGYLAAGLPSLASPVGAQEELAAEFGGVTAWPSDAELPAIVVAELTAQRRLPKSERERAANELVRRVAAARSTERLGPQLLALLRGGSAERPFDPVAESSGVAATRFPR